MATGRNSDSTQRFRRLALPTNIGSYGQGNVTVVPQIELKLGYNVSSNFRVMIGYDFLYWSSVVRPGKQIDLLVNPTQASDSR